MDERPSALTNNSQLTVSLGWTHLHIAVYKQDLQEVKQLLTQNPNINTQDKCQRTPLTIAASKGNLPLVELLIEKGADPNTGFPLHYACEKGHTEVVHYLLKTGADVNLVKDRNYPLNIASNYGHLEIAKILIEHGADLTLTDDTNSTAIDSACHSSNTDLITLLIDSGCDINAKDKFDATPLEVCLTFKEKEPELVKLLLAKGASIDNDDRQNRSYLHNSCNSVATNELIKYGANVNAVDNRNETPLYSACEYDYPECGKVLLQHGADPNIAAKGGLTPLHLAARHGDLEMVKELLERKADVNASSARNVIPLHLAAKNRHPEVVRLLLNQGSLVDVPVIDIGDVNSYSYDYIEGEGHTPFSLTKEDEIRQLLSAKSAEKKEKGVPDWPNQVISWVRSNNLEEIARIPSNDVRFSCRDLMGWTPLHHSVSKGFYEMSSQLIKKGVCVNAPDKFQRTPLSVAASKNHPELISLLVDNGADVNLGDPLHHAIKKKATEAVVQLVKLNCDVNATNTNMSRSTALIEAASETASAIVKILLENKADVNVVDELGQTALESACQFNCLESVKLLLDYGADVNIVDNLKDTPLICAAANGCATIIKLLIENGADIHWEDSSKWTPLHRAIYRELSALELIKAGADVNYFNENVESPLFLGASNPKVVSMLLEHDADPNFVAFGGWTPLHEAVTGRNLDSVKIFLDRGVDVNVGSAENILPIYLAAICGHEGIVQELIDRGSYLDPVILDFGAIRIENGLFSYKKSCHIMAGNTPVIGAAAKGYLKIVRLLHSNGADLGAVNLDGNTALHEAVLGVFNDVVEFLVKEGVDVHVKNNKGKTALDLAKDGQNDALVQILS